MTSKGQHTKWIPNPKEISPSKTTSILSNLPLVAAQLAVWLPSLKQWEQEKNKKWLIRSKISAKGFDKFRGGSWCSVMQFTRIAESSSNWTFRNTTCRAKIRPYLAAKASHCRGEHPGTYSKPTGIYEFTNYWWWCHTIQTVTIFLGNHINPVPVDTW